MFVSREMIGAGTDGKGDTRRRCPALAEPALRPGQETRRAGLRAQPGPSLTHSRALAPALVPYFLYGPIGRITRPYSSFHTWAMDP